MAYIRVDQAIPVFDGQPVTFKSPASCTGIEGLKIYYPAGEGTEVTTFALADAHGNNVGSIDLFAANVLVKVILDTERGMAYVQNADTNAYLEGRFEELDKKTEWQTNPNLLDNWYFGNPVDQRSGYVVPPGSKIYNDAALANYRTDATAYTKANYINGVYGTITVNNTTYYVDWADAVRGYAVAGYTVDCWKSSASSSAIAIADGCINFTVASSGQSINQPMQWEELKGKTVTASMLLAAGATARICLIVVPNYTVRSGYISNGIASVTLTIPEDATDVYVAIQGNTVNNAVKLVAAKLELGEQQTLAHQDLNGNWVLNGIPDYNEQLLRCCMSTADSSDTYANNKQTAAAVNAVPLDGSKAMTGTLNVNIGGNIGRFGVDNTNDYAYMQYAKSDGTSANLTLNPTRARYARKTAANGAWASYDILHTGNKPSGSYTGNGSAAARTIDVGGIGQAMLIRSSEYGNVIASFYSSKLGENPKNFTSIEVSYSDGKLHLATNHDAVNRSGVTYYYQVL